MTLANTYVPDPVLNASIYKLISLVQQPHQVEIIMVRARIQSYAVWLLSLPSYPLTYHILLSLVTVHLGDDLCSSSLHWAMSSMRPETILSFFFFMTISLVPSPVESCDVASCA